MVRLMAGDPFLYASGPRGGAGLRQGRPRLRDRARRLVGHRGPGLRRHPADHQGPPRGRRRHLRTRRSTGRRTPTTAPWCCSPAVDMVGDIAEALVAAGRDPQTPVAMTRVGTTTEQATVTSTLDGIAADARAARMAPPAVIVVGEVVDLRETLSWFETKPLFGWRVLVPRTKEQAGALSRGCAATARCPTRCRPSRSSRRATRCRWTRPSRAWSRAATSGSPSPRSTPSRRCARSSRSTAWTPAPSPASRSPRSARRPRRRSRPGACAPTWCRRASSPPPGCWPTGRSSTTCSTRSTGSSCRAPTSPPRPSSPG